MSEAKFTKGEWIAFYPHEVLVSGHISVESESGRLISQVEVYKSDIDEKTANAHLIAAAPEMYHKLAEVEEYLDSIVGEHSYHRTMREDITELLAKARGEKK